MTLYIYIYICVYIYIYIYICRHGCTQSPQTEVHSNARPPNALYAQDGNRVVSPKEQVKDRNRTSQWMLSGFLETVDSSGNRISI